MTVLLNAHTKEHGEEAEWDRKRNWRELLHILNGRDEVWGTVVQLSILICYFVFIYNVQENFLFFNFQEIPIYFNVSIFLIKLFKVSIQIWLLPNTDTSICTPIAILGIKTMQKQFLLHHLL